MAAAGRSESASERARGPSHIHLFRQRRSSWTTARRSAGAHGPLPQRGHGINRTRFLSGRPTRNASRAESARGAHQRARLDLLDGRWGILRRCLHERRSIERAILLLPSPNATRTVVVVETKAFSGSLVADGCPLARKSAGNTVQR